MSRANPSISKIATMTAEARALVDALALQRVGETFKAPDRRSSVSVVDLNSDAPKAGSWERPEPVVEWTRMRNGEDVVAIFAPTGSSAMVNHPMLAYGSGHDLLLFRDGAKGWLEPYVHPDLRDALDFIDLITTHCVDKSFRAPDGNSIVGVTRVNVGMDGAHTNMIVWNRWDGGGAPQIAFIPDPRYGLVSEAGSDMYQDVLAFYKEARPWLEPQVHTHFVGLYGNLISSHTLGG